MPTLYNDIDQHVLAWTRELIDLGLISKGQTDGRSIGDIQPDDLQLYDRCHFFSGIAGWDYALRLAGWPDGLEVWTGSCPCQSFSTAGKGRGFDDPRGQLWTQFHRLIKARRPKFVFGEQVEGAVRHGWLDMLHSDLETEGYTFRAVVLGAHSSGADHIRQRIYWAGWLPDAINHRRQGAGHGEGQAALQGEAAGDVGEISNGLSDSMPAIQRRDEREGGAQADSRWLAENSISHGRRGRSDGDTAGDDGEVQTQGLGAHGGLPHPRLLRQEEPGVQSAGTVQCRQVRIMEHAAMHGHHPTEQKPVGYGAKGTLGGGDEHRETIGAGDLGYGVEHANRTGPDTWSKTTKSTGYWRAVEPASGRMAIPHRGRLEELRGAEPVAQDFQRRAEEHPAQLRGDSNPWADSTPILCRDNKIRRIPAQPHVQFMAHGLPAGMGAGGDDGRIQIPLGPLVEKGAWQGASKVLKGSGNAIVPQTAAMFIRAIMEEAICHS